MQSMVRGNIGVIGPHHRGHHVTLEHHYSRSFTGISRMMTPMSTSMLGKQMSSDGGKISTEMMLQQDPGAITTQSAIVLGLTYKDSNYHPLHHEVLCLDLS